MQQPKHRKLLIIGCARSGTKYIHKAWRAAGLDIGHEYVGADGSATRFFGVDAPEHPELPNTSPKGRKCHVGERRSDFEFEHVWHQVRDPLKCITSNTLALPRKAFAWLEDFTPIDSKHPNIRYIAMQYWFYWNRICADYATETYRIEDLDKHWRLMAYKLGVKSGSVPDIDKQTNRSLRWARPYVDREAIKKMPDFTWTDLDNVDPILSGHIRTLAESYGYRYAD